MPALLLTLLGSRLAQLGLALLVGFGWGWWKTDAGWRETVAKERAVREAAYQIEIQRQRAAAAEIAAEATDRLQYEITRADDMAARIRELQIAERRDEPETTVKLECKNKSGEIAPVIFRPCRLDGSDIEFLRKLDAPNRPAGSSGAAVQFRKGR